MDADGEVQKVSSHPTILFDGVCNLCSGAVNFIIDRDSSALFRFASIQSTTGAELLRNTGLSAEGMNTVVLIEDGRARLRSDAALEIASRLDGGWRLLGLLLVVPRPLRDLAYNFIAKHRYRIFGRKSECLIPTPERRGRFLPNG